MPSSKRLHEIALPHVGFGGAQVGNLYRAIDDDEAFLTIAAAWELGIRYFDTAPHYGLGLSEERLGRFLSLQDRRDFCLSSKVGRVLEPNLASHPSTDAFFEVPAWKVRRWDFSRSGIRRSVEESLVRLKTDYLDIAYVHDPDEHEREALDVALPALNELKSEGLVRSVGVGMNQSAMLTRFVQRSDVDVVMVAGRLTLLDQSAAKDLVPAARDAGVKIVAAGVFNSGLLARSSPAAGAHYDYAPPSLELLQRAQKISEVCARYHVDLPDAAVAFPRLFTPVVSVVIGCRTREHVQQAVERAQVVPPQEMWDELIRDGLIHIPV